MFDKKKMSRMMSPILQQGVMVRVLTGITLRRLLEDELKLSHDIIDNQIATVFLDGRPVDNIDSAIVKDNSEIALSGAMPGFVGASMRRGGYYSAMRAGITHTDENLAIETNQGLVKIRLYNSLIDLIGPILFSSGFFLSAYEVNHLLTTEIGPHITTHVDKDLEGLLSVSVCYDQ
jgi:hypothetical protein